LYGFSIFYALYGTVQIGGPDGIAQRIAQSNGSDGAMLVIGFLGLLVGAGFKIAAAPLHFWCPDVFGGASIDVSNFLSVASKGAGLVLLLRVLMTIADALGYHNTPHFSLMSIALVIGIVGAITATIGNTGAFSQTNIKRLLAYSSIAHAGYMLCALSLLVSPGGASLNRQTVNTPAQVLLIYLAVYLCMNLGAFTVAGLIWRQTGTENLADYSGLARRAPILAVCMFCFLISLIGLPPFAGFAAKLYLMLALVQNGGWWWALTAIIAFNTVISAFYYFRILRAMYFTDDGRAAVSVHPLGLAVCVCSAIMLLAMMIGYNPLSKVTAGFSRISGVEGAAGR
jgi:NADH-quinone oxidoreductase subunit N